MWLNQDVGNLNRFDSVLKQRLKDLGEWHESVVINCRKLNVYSYCKDTIEMAPYPKILHERKHRSIMAKFRCSDHHLAIETGRHAPAIIDRNYRICIYC